MVDGIQEMSSGLDFHDLHILLAVEGVLYKETYLACYVSLICTVLVEGRPHADIAIYNVSLARKFQR